MTEEPENAERPEAPEIARDTRTDTTVGRLRTAEDVAPRAAEREREDAIRGMGRDTMSQPPERTDGLTTAELARRARTDVRTPATEGIPPRADAPARDREDAVAALPLFSEGETDSLRSRWETIQTGFVDAPRASVEEADALVADAVGRLTEMFAAERSQLESQWGRGDEVSTEDLRVTLRRYRSFFTRLLSV